MQMQFARLQEQLAGLEVEDISSPRSPRGDQRDNLKKKQTEVGNKVRQSYLALNVADHLAQMQLQADIDVVAPVIRSPREGDAKPNFVNAKPGSLLPSHDSFYVMSFVLRFY